MTAITQIIVQAGGRGSRLRHHTWNKPKCLVSVHGKPILFHLFDRFPDAQFYVIGDYAFEQLEKYLLINPPLPDVRLIKAEKHGTCSGISDALSLVKKDKSLLLLWSDLIVGELPESKEEGIPIIYTTDAFTCRWSLSENGQLVEVASHERGIPGLFYFPKASLMPDPPEEGEFVKWFAANSTTFSSVCASDLKELGDFGDIEIANEASGFSRFFNEVVVSESTVSKRAIDANYSELIRRETSWYKEAARLGFRRIPRVISDQPFIMERIIGNHLFQIKDFSLREQRAVFAEYIDALVSLHDKMSIEARSEEVVDVYQVKTLQRVNSVSAVIPGFKKPFVTVNGRKCRNLFSDRHADIIDLLMPRLQPERVHPIHGDPTFSNTLVDQNLRTWFIDPRGYFSKPGIMGDAWYDFAKLYYSAIGGYDAFNRRKFKLHIDEDTVEVLVEEPPYALAANSVFKNYFGAEVARIETLHGLIWLSLSGYVKDDIDSIIGAFYLGLYWLEIGSGKL